MNVREILSSIYLTTELSNTAPRALRPMMSKHKSDTATRPGNDTNSKFRRSSKCAYEVEAPRTLQELVLGSGTSMWIFSEIEGYLLGGGPLYITKRPASRAAMVHPMWMEIAQTGSEIHFATLCQKTPTNIESDQNPAAFVSGTLWHPRNCIAPLPPETPRHLPTSTALHRAIIVNQHHELGRTNIAN